MKLSDLLGPPQPPTVTVGNGKKITAREAARKRRGGRISRKINGTVQHPEQLPSKYVDYRQDKFGSFV